MKKNKILFTILFSFIFIITFFVNNVKSETTGTYTFNVNHWHNNTIINVSNWEYRINKPLFYNDISIRNVRVNTLQIGVIFGNPTINLTYNFKLDMIKNLVIVSSQNHNFVPPNAIDYYFNVSKNDIVEEITYFMILCNITSNSGTMSSGLRLMFIYFLITYSFEYRYDITSLLSDKIITILPIIVIIFIISYVFSEIFEKKFFILGTFIANIILFMSNLINIQIFILLNIITILISIMIFKVKKGKINESEI